MAEVCLDLARGMYVPRLVAGVRSALIIRCRQFSRVLSQLCSTDC